MVIRPKAAPATTPKVPIVEFAEYYKQAIETTLPDLVKYEPRLRVSGFPVCMLKKAWYKITHHVEPDGDAKRSFYLDIGTAAHAIFQRYLGANGQIYGEWKCRKCKHHVTFGCSNECPKCGNEMQYEEFTVKAFKHVSGHLDGIYCDSKGKFWVIDYKTSSVRVIKYQKDNPTLPYQKNKAQILAYVAMIERMLNIKVEGWMLVYIARDDPAVIKVTGGSVSEEKKQQIMRKVKRYDEQYDVFQNLTTYEQLLWLVANKACKNLEYYIKHLKGFDGCPLEAVCFGKQLLPLLRTTWKDYRNGVKPKTVKRSKHLGVNHGR